MARDAERGGGAAAQPPGPVRPAPMHSGSPGRPTAREGRELGAGGAARGGGRAGQGRGGRARGLGLHGELGAGRALGSRGLPGGWEGREEARAEPARPPGDRAARGPRGRGVRSGGLIRGARSGHALGTRAAGRGGACALGTAPLVTQRVGGGEGRRAGRRAHEPERLAGYGSALRLRPRPCCPEGGSGRGTRSDHALRCGVWGRLGTAMRCPALSPAPAPGGPGRLGRANRPLREAESRQFRSRECLRSVRVLTLVEQCHEVFLPHVCVACKGE
ncbi:serine/threonine-protein phosphatase 1 regulatory subunit 10-like [Mustela nigripes]|uniref:serine/threonine-protein phosphatase 1 regulatory subunit 10-like n=1 Tax=Mustela nigripes TaxID=77151 RepID=UPI002815188B|nr:serine/threonine-protein phosphatase 1 regulatory subunit 10-like [Mustela nigripes]